MVILGYPRPPPRICSSGVRYCWLESESHAVLSLGAWGEPLCQQNLWPLMVWGMGGLALGKDVDSGLRLVISFGCFLKEQGSGCESGPQVCT